MSVRLSAIALGWFLGCVTAVNAYDNRSSANFWLPLCKDKNDEGCLAFMQAMADANTFSSEKWGKPIYCVPHSITVEEMRAIIVASTTYADWNWPFLALGYEALSEKFPCPE